MSNDVGPLQKTMTVQELLDSLPEEKREDTITTRQNRVCASPHNRQTFT
jgi:hypothetical protein